jgi:hypothetical protein
MIERNPPTFARAMSALRDALRRLGRAWDRHPYLFGVPGGAALAALWIGLGPAGILLWILLCIVVVLGARGEGDDGER